jgi:hypothetical protein
MEFIRHTTGPNFLCSVEISAFRPNAAGRQNIILFLNLPPESRLNNNSLNFIPALSKFCVSQNT